MIQSINTASGSAPGIVPNKSQGTAVQSDAAAVIQSFASDAGGVNDIVTAKLAELSRVLGNRDSLLKALPESVQRQTEAILHQLASSPATLEAGLVAIAQNQKQAAQQLIELSTSLGEGALFADADLEGLATAFPAAATISPRQATQLVRLVEQAAGELMQPNTSLEKAVQTLQKALSLFTQEQPPFPKPGVPASQPMPPTNASVMTLVRQLAAAMAVQLPEDAGTSSSSPSQQLPTKLLESVMPQSIRQLPQSDQSLVRLTELWAVLKTVELTQWKNLERSERAKAAGNLKKLAQTFTRETAGQGESQPTHTVFSQALPLYFGDHPAPYPAYLHLYRQRDQREGKAGQFETWLRVVLTTENVGQADIVFRLYEGMKLDVRIGIASQEAVRELNEALPDIRSALDSSSLELHTLTTARVKSD